jgi:hypothetical protein
MLAPICSASKAFMVVVRMLPPAANLQQHGGGRLVVGEVDDRDHVVLPKRPQQQAELATVLLNQAPNVLAPADGVQVSCLRWSGRTRPSQRLWEPTVKG